MSTYGPPHGVGPQPWGTPPQDGPPRQGDGRQPGGRAIRVGVVLMVLSVVLGVGLTVLAFLPLFGSGQPVPIRGSHQVQAEAGDTYAIYRLPGVDSSLDCAVEGPGRRAVGLRGELTGSTLNLNGVTYRPEALFDTPDAGAYTVACPGEGERFAVGPRISVMRTVLLGFGGIFGGIALFLTGLVTLIVGVVLRSQRPRTPPYAGGPPFSGAPYAGGPPSSGAPYAGGPPSSGAPYPGPPNPGPPPPGW